MNYETVKYFGAEQMEKDRYDASLAKYNEAAHQTQSTLSLLNVGQNVIFSAGLTAIMGLTTASIVSGDATVGDLVLVNGLLFQVVPHHNLPAITLLLALRTSLFFLCLPIQVMHLLLICSSVCAAFVSIELHRHGVPRDAPVSRRYGGHV